MSAYDNDDRVEWRDDGYALVHAAYGDREVAAENDQRWWTARPVSGSRTIFHVENAHGPFGSADEAIRALIGDPR